jgi:hypothetical protein
VISEGQLIKLSARGNMGGNYSSVQNLSENDLGRDHLKT